MSLERFLTYVKYSQKRPFIARVEGRYYISTGRWAAMISWVRKNHGKENDKTRIES